MHRMQQLTESLAVHDIVRLNNGDQMVITAIHPNRPANPYTGVLIGGTGAEYKFGHRHLPKKLGSTDHNHPAIKLRNARLQQRMGSQAPSTDYKNIVGQLLDAIDNNDWPQAKSLTAIIRKLD